MEKKNNSITIVAVLLFIIGLLLGTFGAYLYFDNSNKNKERNNEIKQDSTKKDNTKEEEVTVPTDMIKVNQKLDEYLAYYMEYRFYSKEKLGINLLNNADDRLEIVNCTFQGTNTGTSFDQGQGLYVKIDDYKNRYKELYGSLDSFEKDTNSKNVNYHLANYYDSSLSSDLVAWIALIGGKVYESVNFNTNNITYNKENKAFTITGIINYKVYPDLDLNDYSRNFTITYANNGTSNYMTSLVIN